MRNLIIILSISLMLMPIVSCTDEDEQTSMSATVMTFNILCSLCNPDYDPWADRLNYFSDIFTHYDADLISLQEFIFNSEVEEVLALASEYTALHYDGYPDSTIFYRTTRFEILDQGDIWLSPTPDIAMSTGFASTQLARLAYWSLMRDKVSGKSFYFIATHFDNNTPSQDLSADLMIEKTESFAQSYPVIFAGDFNSQTYDPAYETLTLGIDSTGFHYTSSFDLADEWSIGINYATEPDYDPAGKIDHIFVSGENWDCSSWEVNMYMYPDESGKYPSDHFPIAAELILN